MPNSSGVLRRACALLGYAAVTSLSLLFDLLAPEEARIAGFRNPDLAHLADDDLMCLSLFPRPTTSALR